MSTYSGYVVPFVVYPSLIPDGSGFFGIVLGRYQRRDVILQANYGWGGIGLFSGDLPFDTKDLSYVGFSGADYWVPYLGLSLEISDYDRRCAEKERDQWPWDEIGRALAAI